MIQETSSVVFSRIYRESTWVKGSGEGSLPINTIKYRSFLQECLAQEAIHTVLDIGCGDWQSSCLIDWTGIAYIGVDTVPEIITQNRKRYSSPAHTFLLADAVEHDLPSSDLLIMKDVLQHWPDSMIVSTLPRLLQRCRIALLTNDIRESGPHLDCTLGAHRPLDLRSPPFNFPLTEALRETVNEVSQGKKTDKVTYLYRNASPLPE